MVDGRHGDICHVYHTCLTSRTRPLVVVHFPPQLVAFPQCVGGLSVCAHRLTEAYTEAYRATDVQINAGAAGVTSSSLK